MFSSLYSAIFICTVCTLCTEANASVFDVFAGEYKPLYFWFNKATVHIHCSVFTLTTSDSGAGAACECSREVTMVTFKNYRNRIHPDSGEILVEIVSNSTQMSWSLQNLCGCLPTVPKQVYRKISEDLVLVGWRHEDDAGFVLIGRNGKAVNEGDIRDIVSGIPEVKDWTGHLVCKD